MTDNGPGNTDVLDKVKKFINYALTIQADQCVVSVLFADLVGSTEFKRDNPIEVGLAKTYVHNRVVTDCVENAGGRIVKFIGDGVMAVFQGNDCQLNALKTGIEIIKEIDNANHKHHWNVFPMAMSTRVGVHTGPVWMFKYDGEVSDPQGNTVDIAARLVSLANPGQVVCTKECFEKEQGRLTAGSSQDVCRYLKGFKEPFELKILVPSGWSIESDDLGNVPELLQQELDRAADLAEKGKRPEALREFSHILEKDPGNFQANIHCAEIKLRVINGSSLGENTSILDAIEDHLKKAVWARPDSCRVWLLYSWLLYKRYEIGQDESILDEAISFSRKSISLATKEMNISSSLQGRIYLANYLLTRFKKTKDQSLLADAQGICFQMDPLVDDILQSCQSDFHVVKALTLLFSGEENHGLIEEIIEKARECNPRNFRVCDVEGELRRKQFGDSGLAGLLVTQAK